MNKKLKKIIDWLQEYKEKTNCKGVVLGLSGGKDSTVVAMLAKLIWGDNVFAVLMPNGEQKDISDSLEIARTLNLNHRIVNIETVYNALINVVENRIDDSGKEREIVENCPKITEKSKTNIPPRIRMTVLYAIAQSMGYRVIGTGNKSEAYIGWTTKYGDSAYDFNPIGDLTCSEVIEVGLELAEFYGLDKRFIEKKPADGLCGKSDEDSFGFSYEELDSFIKTGSINKVNELNLMDFISGCWIPEKEKNIKEKNRISQHKREMPPICTFEKYKDE